MRVSKKIKSIFNFIGVADFIASVLIAIVAVEAWDFATMPYVGVCAVLGIICLALSGAFEM